MYIERENTIDINMELGYTKSANTEYATNIQKDINKNI
jgi:hypothetical protein